MGVTIERGKDDSLSPDALTAEVKQIAEIRVERAGRRLVQALQKTLRGARHGRTYRVPKTQRTYVASAPGEAPAVMLGTLRRSIQASVPEWDGNGVSVTVGTNVVYARRLEWGGVDKRGVRILRRPWMAPTFLVLEPILDAILRGEMK